MEPHAAIPDHVPPDRVIDFDVYFPPRIEQGYFAAWTPLIDGPGMVWTPRNGGHWIATNGADIWALWSDAARLSSEVLTVPAGMGAVMRPIPLQQDQPEHVPFRSAVMKGFASKFIVALEPEVVAVARQLIDGIVPNGSCEFASEFAEILPISSPTSQLQQTQQDLLDKMLVGDPSTAGVKTVVPAGQTARAVMADQLRRQMAADYGLDYSARSVPEMIDSLKYNIFPNLFVYSSVGLPLLQLFRPDGDDHDRALFDQMVFRPKPTDGSHWEVAEPVIIEEGQSFTEVAGMDPFLAHVLDQDTDIMRWQREGMYASEKGAETLSIYQESRIRHFHETIDSYLADGDGR